MDPNKERLQLWVDALRSDEYKQGFEALFDGEGHCCLGVACEVALANGAIKKLPWKFDEKAPRYANGTLPPDVRAWFGFDGDNPVVGVSTRAAHDCGWPDCERKGQSVNIIASTANDDEGWSFNQIADSVEEYYSLLKIEPEPANV